MATPYELAAGLAGTREGQSALTDYLRTGGVNIDPTTRAWCADFVNATMNKAGQKGTDSGMARSFMQWGQAVAEPQQGDVAVFSRGADPSKGHVGFFDSVNPDGTIKVLGGNQSDSVSYGDYPAERLLGYRRAPGDLSTQPDGPKGQESYGPAPATTPPSGGFTPPSPIPTGVASYATDDGKKKKSMLGSIGDALSAVPNAPAPNLGPMGDARASGDALNKAMGNPTIASVLMKKRIGGLLG